MDSYGSAMQGVTRGTTIESAPAETEMETLSNLTGNNRRQLRSALDMIESRLDRFTSAPQTLPPVPKAGQEPSPEPQPGTLASLRWAAEKTTGDLNRLDAICDRLQALL